MTQWERWKAFLYRHAQTIINVCLFIDFGTWIVWSNYKIWASGKLGFAEIAFAVHNVILISVILVRKPHREINRNWRDQLIALIAFCSGVAFMGQPSTAGPLLKDASNILIFTANLLGIVTLLNLGRSFGILIAYREVKSGGLYAFVRHPMYGTDILLRIGFLISHFTLLTVSIFIASSACYVYRALLEERFLGVQPEYRDYMKRVRYRFLPGVY